MNDIFFLFLHVEFTNEFHLSYMKKLIPFFAYLTIAFQSIAQTYNVVDYGAVGDGSTVNTVAIQAAIDSCFGNGGGEVLFSGGDFVTGTIFLKSDVILNIESGATLLGSPSIADYPDAMPQLPTYVNNYTNKTLVYAEDAENIGFTGSGTFDGQGINFLNEEHRPFGFRFISCSNVLIEDVSFRNSVFWMMHNFDIDSLVIRNIDIFNHGNANNDGINIDGCRNVLVENCSIDSNDDPMVLKTTGPANCEDVEIRNCTVATWSRALKIGTETHAGFRNIHLHDLTVEWSSLAVPFLGVGAGSCGINLAIVDGGFMENVTVENVTMEGIETAIFVRLGNRGRVYEAGMPAPAVGYLRDVTIRNVEATVESNITSSITGIPGFYAENIQLEDVAIEFPGGASDPGPSFTVPENEDAKPDNDIFGSTLPSYGLYVRHVDSLQLTNVCFNWKDSDARPGIMLDDVTNSLNYIAAGIGGGCAQVSSAIRELIDDVKFWVDPEGIIHLTDKQNRVFQLELLSSDGKLVFNESIRSGANKTPELPTGVYLARITSKFGQKTVKFIR